jgi:predicted fused transcriptional regulator/phosphomethylpyrimidine kinase
MASTKSLSVEEAIEIVYNDDSGDELIPELDSSDSESEEDEHAVSGAVQVSEDIPDTSPSHRPPASNFTANVGLNIDIANSDDVISFVNLFITDEFF